MRNLIVFFKRFRVFMLFALLQGVAIYQYLNTMAFPKSQYMTSASAVNGKILEYEFEVTKHFNLAYNNTKLQKKNIILMEQRPESFIKIQNGIYKINDTLFQQQYEYIPAIVIKSTFDKRNNYFTLNVGSSQGIERDMGVFSDNGIVGVVHLVSEHYSVVKSVLTDAINIDVMIESKDSASGAFGLLKWNGRNARIGSVAGISNDTKIKRWSKVVTRGGSGIFPRGLVVGKVSEYAPVEGKPLWDISVLYAEDYRRIQRVYVIKNLLKTEQKKLESLIPPEEAED